LQARVGVGRGKAGHGLGRVVGPARGRGRGGRVSVRRQRAGRQLGVARVDPVRRVILHRLVTPAQAHPKVGLRAGRLLVHPDHPAPPILPVHGRIVRPAMHAIPIPSLVILLALLRLSILPEPGVMRYRVLQLAPPGSSEMLRHRRRGRAGREARRGGREHRLVDDAQAGHRGMRRSGRAGHGCPGWR